MQLQWFYEQDYLCTQLMGINAIEVDRLKAVSMQAYRLFEQATDHIIQHHGLDSLDIPAFFQPAIIASWRDRNKVPMLLGRMDINGGIDGMDAKIIEYNADTCTTLPETILWQSLQKEKLQPQADQFNNLSQDIAGKLRSMKQYINYETPLLVATSMGHDEDVLNCHAIMDIARTVGMQAMYTDLEHLTFSATEGVFLPMGDGYEPVDILYKMIPWDWMYQEEPDLAMLLAEIITKKLCMVLNPPFTAIWQHKKFLAYITQHFPNSVIAATYMNKNAMRDYVIKPALGRMGEAVTIVKDGQDVSPSKNAGTEPVYQKYYPLIQDKKGLAYQLGMFIAGTPVALNIRSQSSTIINDDCTFVSHFIG